MAKTTQKGKDRLELAVKEYIKGVYITREHSYTWTQALLDAGYSETYARSRCTELYKKAKPAIDIGKEEVLGQQRYNLQDWEGALKDLYVRCIEKTDRTNEKAVIDMGLKLNGGYVTLTKDVSEITPIPAADQVLVEEATKELTVRLSRNTGS